MKQWTDVLGVAVIMLFLFSPCPAGAQDARKLSITGAIDYTRITDDESFLGAGLGGAGGIQWRLTDATAVEVEIGRARHVRDLGSFAVAQDAQGRLTPIPYTRRWQGTATFVIASISHAFGAGRAQPVIWGGGGLMSHGGTRRGPVVAPQVPAGYTLQPGELDTVEGRSTTALTFDGGTGLDVRIAEKIAVRPFVGLRFSRTGNFGPKYIIRSGVRIGFGF